MKKVILFFALFAGYFGYGQTHYGIKGGLSLSNVNGTYTSELSTLAGYNLGAVLKVDLSDEIQFSPELLFSNKGYNAILIPFGTTAHRLSYLSIPLLAQYNFTPKFYLQLGPEFNFLLTAKAKWKNHSGNITHSYNSFDAGLAGGPGIKISKNLFLEGRYALGLTQINKNASLSGKHRTGTFQIDVVYLLKK
ncbi:MAG: PorT family protein [Chitinophagaceae bacterium]|nr:PorT family protein [Chitinophagaceae bacterium]